MGEGHLKGHAPEGPEAGGALSPVRGRGGRGTGDEGRHTETGPGSPSLSPAALSSPWPGSGCRGPGRAGPLGPAVAAHPLPGRPQRPPGLTSPRLRQRQGRPRPPRGPSEEGERRGEVGVGGGGTGCGGPLSRMAESQARVGPARPAAR